mmetsp:Transcript_98769/g.255234  ORF Transcript_98769/g.255234 Transcript_98769/m.255234 type:complete len:223 (-) Transcript_98769:2134-2802(-)
MSLLRYKLYNSSCACVKFSHKTTSTFPGNSIGSPFSVASSAPTAAAAVAASEAAAPPPTRDRAAASLALAVAADIDTSHLRRRKKCGAVSLFSSLARWSLSSTANLDAFRFEPFAICSEKLRSKVAWLPKSAGCAKSINAQRSLNLFCSGVPVSKNRERASSFLNALPETHDGFLMACASSAMTTSQGRQWSSAAPCTAAMAPARSSSASDGLSSSRVARVS